MPEKPILVTQPHLPPLEDFIPLLQQIWDRKILTNGGPFHQQLEQALCDHLGVKHISLFSNGTIALITALRALDIQGEVITTPYSFVATAHALVWSGNKPVFVDIDPQTLNLDPRQIESAITPRTTAILPVHCYGNPCDVDEIEAIAARHGLRVIYDAAHAFGVQCHCGSVLNHGDLSVLSFHATKVFNTFEGGAIVSHDAATKLKIDRLKNFGFAGETAVVATGMNGKMSELQAAIGLLQLATIDSIIGARAAIDKRYRDAIEPIEGLNALPTTGQHRSNYSYFPILVGDTYPLSRDSLYEYLKTKQIFSRRYFFPLITDFSMYQTGNDEKILMLPNAQSAAQRILCLPIYPELSTDEQSRVIQSLLDHVTTFN
jgi:dTDP-4-amino-4,6-dideoxygalactose transaminase